MKALIFVFVICLVTELTVCAQEAPPGREAIQSTAGIPKGYSVGEESISPNARFAIL